MSGVVPPLPGPRPMKRQIRQRPQHNKIVLYAIISLASFLCAALLLAVMVWKANTLTQEGLIGHMFYPILLMFGLCASVFLFGVMQSYANYRGQHFGGVLELGGPAVVFALVVVGGKMLVPDVGTFSIAVYVHGPRGHQDIVLQHSGTVFLDLDQRAKQEIGDEGQAVFPTVPAKFRNQEVPVSLQSDAYETIGQAKLRLAPPLVYLPVTLRPGHINVHVVDQKDRPIREAEIRVESDFLGKTNDQGDLEKEFRLHSPNPKAKLRVHAEGYGESVSDISPHTIRTIEIQLKPER
jgi:hypothetical protein